MTRCWLFAVTLFLAAAPLSSFGAPHIPEDAVRIEKDSLGRRASQTRRFQTADEIKLLRAGAAVLQDLGFNIDASETKLGLVVASKTRDASDAAQQIGAVVLGAIVGADFAVDKIQNITASYVTRPSLKGNILVRVMFQRIVYNDRNEVSRVEGLDDPELYQQFFSRLEKSVFLEAHGL